MTREEMDAMDLIELNDRCNEMTAEAVRLSTKAVELFATITPEDQYAKDAAAMYYANEAEKLSSESLTISKYLLEKATMLKEAIESMG